MRKTVTFREQIAFYLADVNYRDSKKRLSLRLVNHVYPLFKLVRITIHYNEDIVCEVDCLEDNEPIMYGPYAQRNYLDHNEFDENEDEERASERANE